jgi:hypothetical protein
MGLFVFTVLSSFKKNKMMLTGLNVGTKLGNCVMPPEAIHVISNTNTATFETFEVIILILLECLNQAL